MLEDQVAVGSRGTSSTAFVRWGGMALVAGGLLLVVATVLHPSQETPVTILETEVRLVGSHAVSVASYVLVLLGLPALYSPNRNGWDDGVDRFLGGLRGNRPVCHFQHVRFLRPGSGCGGPRNN